MENQNIVIEKQPMKNKNMILWVKPGTEFWGDIRVKGDVFVDDRCCIHGKIVADNVYFGSGITASNIYAKGYFFCKNGNFFGNVTAERITTFGSVIMSDTATVYESIGAQNVKKVEFDKPEGKIFTIEKEPNGKTTSANI